MGVINVDAHFSSDAFVEIQRQGASDRFNATVDIDNFEESGFEREVESRTT